MPLNLSNRDQNSGHLFYNRRLRAAITRFSVRMKHDDRKQQEEDDENEDEDAAVRYQR